MKGINSRENQLIKATEERILRIIEDTQTDLIKDNSFVRLGGDDLLNEFVERIKKKCDSE